MKSKIEKFSNENNENNDMPSSTSMDDEFNWVHYLIGSIVIIIIFAILIFLAKRYEKPPTAKSVAAPVTTQLAVTSPPVNNL